MWSWSRITSSLSKLNRTRQVKLLMLGLDNAGKTTLLSSILAKRPHSTVATIGDKVEVVAMEDVKFQIREIGGSWTDRELWRHFCRRVDGVIFVVDSACPSRFDEARNELTKVLAAPELQHAPLLLLANKQDLPSALSASEIAELMDLEAVLQNPAARILESNAVTGEALIDGLVWLDRPLAT